MTDPSQFTPLISALSDQDAALLKTILTQSQSAGKTAEPNSFLFSVATAGFAAVDVAYVKQRFRDFLQRIVELSLAAQPPGAQAANGFFRQYMVTDARLAQLGAPPTLPLGSQAQALFDVYTAFYGYVRNDVFARCENVPGERILDAIFSELGAVIQFALNLLTAIFGSDQQQREQAAAQLSQEIGPLVQRLNDNANSPINGTHASGWIAKFSSDTAFFTKTLLDQKVPPNTPGQLGQIADVIRAMLTQLNLIPFDGMNPWLKGAWQLQYQSVLRSAVIALDTIQTLPLQKQDRPAVPSNPGALLQN